LVGNPRLKHPVGVRQLKETELLTQIYQASHCRYGSPRIADELKDGGVKACRNRVARLMNKGNIKSILHKKYRVQTTDSDHDCPVANNLLDRNFQAEELGQKWVSDITAGRPRYVQTGEGWLYLTTILDLADRKVIGWSLSDSLKTSTTSIAAWQMATKNRPLERELLFHSDRGIQYASAEFRAQLKGQSVVQSMTGPPGGRKGNCWDNAVAESFFKTLKAEMIYHCNFDTRRQAKLAIFEYIEGWYNRKRKHSALGYLTPCQREAHFINELIAA
jgi:putative transposase